jgi:hypothetical protein
VPPTWPPTHRDAAPLPTLVAAPSKPSFLYLLVQQHLQTYLALACEGDGDGHAVPGYVERELWRYLEVWHSGLRLRLRTLCGQDFLVVFSCKWRGVCPSCNARRMASSAAYLVDHVFPPLPVRQWDEERPVVQWTTAALRTARQDVRTGTSHQRRFPQHSPTSACVTSWGARRARPARCCTLLPAGPRRLALCLAEHPSSMLGFP